MEGNGTTESVYWLQLLWKMVLQYVLNWAQVWAKTLEKEMATHSNLLAWKIPWTEEPRRLQSMGRKGSDTTERLTHTWAKMHVPYDLAVPLLDTGLIKMHTHVFTVTLFIIAKTGNNPTSISSGMVKWVVVYSYIPVESHIAMKK